MTDHENVRGKRPSCHVSRYLSHPSDVSSGEPSDSTCSARVASAARFASEPGNALARIWRGTGWDGAERLLLLFFLVVVAEARKGGPYLQEVAQRALLLAFELLAVHEHAVVQTEQQRRDRVSVAAAHSD